MQNKIKLILILLVAPLVAAAQTTITGTVKDHKGITLPGANIYLDDTFDGANSDINGNFTFESEETGSQVLMVSFIGFKTLEKVIELNAIKVDTQ